MRVLHILPYQGVGGTEIATRRIIGDAAALAGCIARVLDDPGLAARLGEAGREEVRQRFGHDRFAADLLALYRRLARRPVGLATPGSTLGAAAAGPG